MHFAGPRTSRMAFADGKLCPIFPWWPPTDFYPRLPVTIMSVSWLPVTGATSPRTAPQERELGAYRRAISAGEAICDGSVRSFAAGSALVPPSAARSDAVAGSTLWPHALHPAKPCGSPKASLPEGEAPDNEPNTRRRRAPEGHRRAGFGFHRGRFRFLLELHLTLCSCKVCQAGPDHEVMKGPDHVEIGEAEGIVGVHDGCRDELRAGWRIATEQR